MIAPRRLFIEDRGLPLHLTLFKAKPGMPALIFFYGMNAHTAFSVKMIPGCDDPRGLAGTSFYVVMGPDLQGHGRSGGQQMDFTYAGAIRNIRCAVDFALTDSGRPMGITGSSAGSILALYTAPEELCIRAAVCHNGLDLRDIRPALHLRRHFVRLPPAQAARPLREIPRGLPVPVRVFPEPSHVFEWSENLQRWQAGRFACGVTGRGRGFRFSWIVRTSLPSRPWPRRSASGSARGIGSSPPIANGISPARLRCRNNLVILPGAGRTLPLEYLGYTVPSVARWFREHLRGEEASRWRSG